MMMYCLIVGSDMEGTKGITMILSGMVFLLGMGVPTLILDRIERTDLHMREHILRLELLVAELSEKIAGAKK
jgi:hypothetical protein